MKSLRWYWHVAMLPFAIPGIVACGYVIDTIADMPALAHDASRPELNTWFNNLASGKGLCCSNNDGLMVADVDWKSDHGHYQVRIDGAWVDVPDDAVVNEPNRDGRTMVWPIKGYGELMIRCFMPGSMT
jgi:hypothetical protein